MKILMVTPYVPYPPSSGGQIRTFNLLKHLSQSNEITLVALYKNQKEKDYYSYLKNFCKKIYLCQRPEKPWVFKNILPHIPKTNTPIVLVEQTIEYNVYKHFVNSLPFYLRMLVYFDIDIIKLRYWERFYWKKANIVVAVSSPDEKIIKNEEEEIKTSVIPNGAGDEMIVLSLEKKDLKKPVVFFQGNFFWLQNVEAAKFLINKIYPLLIKNNPNINVVIAGQNAGKIGEVNFKKIKIVDISSDDTQKVKKLFREADLFIAPIFGPGGTRLKILAAMGSGIPVISTETGVEGLDVTNNSHVLTAKSPSQFVEKIENILRDKRNYEKIRSNALSLVKNKYQWQGIANKLETVYKNL
ncbi:MAG: Glycosyl transferase, family I [Candidatus Roizmanbacteria bacterium GW2011_GWA2_35_8]|uniref:Glycosyl transferase, family I n=1 Tax=Candidatus Roizmanbacteria bacterium GW2011_GWA2_35_8 TaxID=1618479 RepID=A0A0G0CXD7_9BACT|nr:MAG: Glycosyl transferase, family I [Candidatus Roizmanbacteria bacterium GW2011_GWA2_35_8]